MRHQAELHWDGTTPPATEYVQIKVTYFYEAVSMDVDNIVKPIQDALVGLVYVDDEQVTDIVVRKRHINNAFTSEHMSPVLIEGLTRRNQFLHIVVAIAPNQEDLDQ